MNRLPDLDLSSQDSEEFLEQRKEFWGCVQNYIDEYLKSINFSGYTSTFFREGDSDKYIEEFLKLKP